MTPYVILLKSILMAVTIITRHRGVVIITTVQLY